MDAAWSYETVVSYHIVECHNTEDHELNLHHFEHLNSYNRGLWPPCSPDLSVLYNSYMGKLETQSIYK